MKKIANAILEDNQEENVVFMTEDGQGFFDLNLASNHAKKNDFEDPEPFYRAGFEPEDTKALAEQLEFAKEEIETLSEVLSQIETAVDFTQEAPEVNQETNEVVAAVVQLRDRSQDATVFIQKIVDAVFTDEVVVDEKAEPVIVEIMKQRVSLKIVQAELDTLRASSIPVESQVEPAAKPAKNGK